MQAVLPAWAHVWPRLVLDNDRAVRYEAAAIMALLAQVTVALTFGARWIDCLKHCLLLDTM